MNKLLMVLGLVLLLSVFPTWLVAGDPSTQTYLIDRYGNNAGPGSTMDQLLRLINVGQGGTPLTSPVGDVCANIYVFDNNQEMISCCSCRLTPNELATASVANQLTNNPLTSVIPTAGVIKIVPSPAQTAACSPAVPLTSSDASLLQGFVTHLEKTGPATYITETNMASAPLASGEADFLSNACLFVKYLGSSYGKGTCSCSAPGESGTVTYSLSGTVSGAGGNGAAVQLTGTATATATADALGHYSFTGLQNGSYTVTPSKTGFTFTPASQPATVNNANVTVTNFSTVTYSISGTIGGTGGNGATVALSGTSTASVTADALGNYTFTNLMNGSYTVKPSKPGFIFTPANQAVPVSGADIAGVNFTSTGRLAIDQVASTDRGSAGTTITSPTFTTTNPNELLLAFISTDANSAGITVSGVTSVTQATLTWSLVRRTNTQLGTSEIWRAFTPATLSGTSVRATLSQSVPASITVVTFRGVDTSGTGGSGAIGATGGNSANPGAPTASLTTTRNNSWVIGVGNDWFSAASRTVGPNQTMVHQFLAPNGDTFWVQRQTSTTALAGTVVTINDTAPTGDSYNLSICEVLPAP